MTVILVLAGVSASETVISGKAVVTFSKYRWVVILGKVITGRVFAAQVITLVPFGKVTASSLAEEIEVTILKVWLKFTIGVKATLANNSLTCATVPVAVHTPLLNVELTPVLVRVVVSIPAEGTFNVNLAVICAPRSGSSTTISVISLVVFWVK